VVSDVDAAQTAYTRVLGLAWGRPIRHRVQFLTADGVLDVDLDLVYSLGQGPHLELIAQRHGSPYAALGLHHAGHWVEDVAAASEALEAAGWPRECVPVDAGGAWIGGAYHRAADGLRIEIVSAPASGPKLARYLQGGPYA
jgi:catechol 2,3-dioxygenase-like lactoylglutathione lyase family enzyme